MSRSSAKIRDQANNVPAIPPRLQTKWVLVSFFLPVPGQLWDGVASTPLIPAARGRKESAVKPGSVVDSHSSGMRVTAQL